MFTLDLDQTVSWSFEAAGTASDWLETFAEAMGISRGAGKTRRHMAFEELPSKPGDPFGPVLGLHLMGLRSRAWKFRDLGGLSFFEHPAVGKSICGLEAGLVWPFRIEQMRRSLLPVFFDAVLAGGAAHSRSARGMPRLRDHPGRAKRGGKIHSLPQAP